MLKQNKKSSKTTKTRKTHKVEHTIVHPVAERVGAIALTVMCALVSFEAIIEHQSGEHNPHTVVSEVFARGETKGEAARIPEEFDIGMQTPHITSP